MTDCNCADCQRRRASRALTEPTVDQGMAERAARVLRYKAEEATTNTPRPGEKPDARVRTFAGYTVENVPVQVRRLLARGAYSEAMDELTRCRMQGWVVGRECPECSNNMTGGQGFSDRPAWSALGDKDIMGEPAAGDEDHEAAREIARAELKRLDDIERKSQPLATGCLDYFPDALAAVANCSWVATQQHHPGEPMHWDRTKSTDEANTLLRHFRDRGTIDTDGVRHSAKVAWRALALLQKEIEAARR